MPLAGLFEVALVNLAEKFPGHGGVIQTGNFFVDGKVNIHIPFRGVVGEAEPVGYGGAGGRYFFIEPPHEFPETERNIKKGANPVFDEFLVLPFEYLVVPGGGIEFRAAFLIGGGCLVHGFYIFGKNRNFPTANFIQK